MSILKADPLPWLLEEDPENPGVCYFALRDLLDKPEEATEVRKARKAVVERGPVPKILEAQQPEGYWVKAGSGYSPKYKATAWQIIFLAELGADPADERVQRGCEYVLGHSRAANGAFSAYNPPVASGAVPCLNGNLLHALIRLGREDDARLQEMLHWQAQAVTGEGGMRYIKSGTSGPDFSCSANLGQPCGWGGTKVLRGLLALPKDKRTSDVQRAISRGANFLLRHDLAKADFPYTGRISSTWFKLGFPLSYWSDILETAGVLTELGYGKDPRLAEALELILSKQDSQGRWKLENPLNGKMWADIETKRQPSKWITLRVMRVLKRAGMVLV